MNVQIFLAGDVMTGRGIDQVLAHPSNPKLYEPHVRDARSYVALAEVTNGTVPAPVQPDYIWGDALRVLDKAQPTLRIVNLETAVTTSDAAWTSKGIHYRMNPANIDCLTAAQLDACVLANNHVLDWGHQGLRETLSHLHQAGLKTAGAGDDLQAAIAPAVLPVSPSHRVLLFAWGTSSSGIPPAWSAGAQRAGVALLTDLSHAMAQRLAEHIVAQRRAGDLVIVSLHWGE
ncbi:MAG: CapA family protein, partial [Pseudomonadota bacterium]